MLIFKTKGHNMKQMIQKLKLVFKRALGLVPTKLPQGMTEFHLWADSVIELAGLPNNDSTKFSVATMILHLPPTDAYKAKEYFVRSLIKAAANQIAHGTMTELKEKQVKLAEQEKANAEAKNDNAAV